MTAFPEFSNHTRNFACLKPHLWATSCCSDAALDKRQGVPTARVGGCGL